MSYLNLMGTTLKPKEVNDKLTDTQGAIDEINTAIDEINTTIS